MSKKNTVRTFIVILVISISQLGFAKSESEILDGLKSLIVEKITEDTKVAPVYVDIAKLKNAHNFGRPTKIGTIAHRAELLAKDKLSKESPTYYSALITMKPAYASHTVIDYICALKIEENLTSIDLVDCEINYRTNFPVFSFDTDPIQVRNTLGKID